MHTLRAVSDDDAPRHLDVERRGSEVYLCAHPPDNTSVGQDILVPHVDLLAAAQSGAGRIAGVSPVHRKPKECVVERRHDGLRIQIHPISQLASWWVVVKSDEFEAAIA